MGKNKNMDTKKSSMVAKDKDSLNSVTGYKETGNPATANAKARAIRK